MPSADGTALARPCGVEVQHRGDRADRVRDARERPLRPRRGRASRSPRSTEWTTTAGRKPSAPNPIAVRNGNGPSMPDLRQLVRRQRAQIPDEAEHGRAASSSGSKRDWRPRRPRRRGRPSRAASRRARRRCSARPGSAARRSFKVRRHGTPYARGANPKSGDRSLAMNGRRAPMSGARS